MKLLVTAALLALLPISAQAQSPDCAQPMTQADMNICASRAYVSADALLNQIWRSAISSAKERDTYLRNGDIPSEDMLRQAQRSWIVFRDQACLAESTVARGGSIQPLIQYVCLERLTLNRIDDLAFFEEIN
jgi:uncharacterized protein YecT (DUF1311 family)